MPVERQASDAHARGADSTNRADGRGGGDLRRITVNLTPRAWEALEQAVKLTGDSKTDTLNRAIQVYAYLMNITQNDGAVYVRDAGHDELQRLRVV
jgi:hypothetical protein